ncbi:MAG TPA: hypothetical protein VJP02_08935 [Candidatus Sulfotelmatobacter sp.]|nr:hypothetical protein [Candidatus Sulfotelmatobacter sp.]
MRIVPKIPPSAYVNWYKSIDVWTSAGPVKEASVTRYLCNLPQYGGLGDSLSFWQSIIQAGRAKQVTWSSDKIYGATQCFYGKGSPDDVAYALRIVEDVAAAALDHPALKPFRSILEDEDDRLADVCTKYIGVDCNGFVGNYGKENALPKADRNLLPSLWKNVGPIDEWRSSVDDIKELDVLIWPHGSHIAIIDSMDHGQFTICQSTGGGGPQTSTGHTIKAAGQTAEGTAQFAVSGGSPRPITLPATVRIKSVGFEVVNYPW